MEGIIAAIITGVLSLIGVVISNIAANAKMSKELEKAQAVTDTKIEELTREVREHIDRGANCKARKRECDIVSLYQRNKGRTKGVPQTRSCG